MAKLVFSSRRRLALFIQHLKFTRSAHGTKSHRSQLFSSLSLSASLTFTIYQKICLYIYIYPFYYNAHIFCSSAPPLQFGLASFFYETLQEHMNSRLALFQYNIFSCWSVGITLCLFCYIHNRVVYLINLIQLI